MTTPGEGEGVTLTADALALLMRKCQTLGWEVCAGVHTDTSADAQRARLFLEFTGRRHP